MCACVCLRSWQGDEESGGRGVKVVFFFLDEIYEVPYGRAT